MTSFPDDPQIKGVRGRIRNIFREADLPCGQLRVHVSRENGIKPFFVENSGFQKGYRRNGVGISSNHSLALVNYSGTTVEILSLADDIENAVYDKFGIRLQKEAVVI